MEYGRILVYCVLTLAMVNPLVRMKTLIISCALLLLGSATFAQTSSDTIVVAPGQSGLYFYHIVQKGESLASLSREYGLQQEALSRLNKTQNLQPYEMIKIPLASSQIVQTSSASDHLGLKPLYHKVLKGETLFRVGKLYGDIPLDQLRQWNNLRGNNVGIGQYLIIGWLKKPTAQPPVARVASTTVTAQTGTQTDSQTTEARPKEKAAPPATEPAATSEGHSFLQEVIASEKHRARNTGSLATETAVARPLLSGAPERPGPAVANNHGGTNQAVSHPLLPSQATATATETNTSPTTQQNSSLNGTHSSSSGSTPMHREKQQKPATVPAQVATADSKKTEPATPPKGSAKESGQEAKESNPFEKMLNQITGKKKETASQATKTTSAQPTEQRAIAQTTSQADNTTDMPSAKQPATQTQTAATTANTETTATTPTAKIPPATPASAKEVAGRPLSVGSSSGPLTGSEAPDSASLHLAQKSEFQELYLAQTQGEKLVTSKKGAAGWFKSNVKAGSKKYYALCNDLPRGTIVKVINPINKRFVFVKVLSSIPEQKENYNLVIKLSDAAMEDLGTHQPRFWSEIVYPRLKD